MVLTHDYKSIIKLRFNSSGLVTNDFFNKLHYCIEKPDQCDISFFNDLDLTDILYYLQKSHQEYLNVWFPKIEALADDIHKDLGTNELTLTLNTFLVNYFNELSNHINFEEKVLYNFANKLLKGIYVESEKMFVLNHFLETHSHAVENDLISIQKRLLNLNPDIIQNSKIKELFDLFDLVHHDLKIHGLIEDEIFIDKIHQYINTHF
jgi:hypothetical protein